MIIDNCIPIYIAFTVIIVILVSFSLYIFFTRYTLLNPSQFLILRKQFENLLENYIDYIIQYRYIQYDDVDNELTKEEFEEMQKEIFKEVIKTFGNSYIFNAIAQYISKQGLYTLILFTVQKMILKRFILRREVF